MILLDFIVTGVYLFMLYEHSKRIIEFKKEWGLCSDDDPRGHVFFMVVWTILYYYYFVTFIV